MNTLEKIKNIDIKKAVLDKIKSGSIKPYSKFYFTSRNALLVLTIVIIFLVLLFITSFVIFALKTSELWFLPVFGMRGIEILVANFPWVLVFIIIIFTVFLEVLANRFNFVFLRPLLYSVLIIVFIVVTFGFFLNDTPLHSFIYEKAKQNNLPVVKPFYDDFTRPNPEDFHPGTAVDEIKDNSFSLELADKTIVFVKISKNTKMGKGFEIYKGGRLLILGKIKDGIIEAEAIQNAPNSGRP